MYIKELSDANISCSGTIGWDYNPDTDRYEDLDFVNLHSMLQTKYKDRNTTISLLSGGGDVFTGEALAGAVRAHGKTTIVGYGIVGSAATFMFYAAKRSYLEASASLFIHNASTFAWGTKEDFAKASGDLAKIDADISEKYVNQIELTGKLINGSREETLTKIEKMMREETTLNAIEAFNLGLCDGYYNLSGKLIKQPKEKPNEETEMGEPMSDPEPMDMGKMPEKTKNQIGQSVASLVQKYERANVKNARAYYQNFLGESLNISNPPIQKMETPNPAAEQQNPSPIAGAETATPEQKKGFISAVLAYLGFNQPSVAEVQNQAPEPAIQPTAPIAEPTNEAPAQTPPAPVTPAPTNETPIVPPTPPTPVNEIPKPAGAQDVLNEKSGQGQFETLDLEKMSNPLDRLKALATFKEQCFADRSQDNHPDTIKAFEGIKDAALKA